MLIKTVIFISTALMFNFTNTSANKISEEIAEYEFKYNFVNNYSYEVVKTIYKNFKEWFFTIILCDFSYFENMIIKQVETYAYGHPAKIHSGCPTSDSSKVKPKIDSHGATAYIVTSNELSLDVNDAVIVALKRTGVWKPRTVLIFVINAPLEIDSYFNYNMENHFNLLWGRRISKSILIVWSGRMRIYTYHRYQKQIIELTDAQNISMVLDRQFNNLYSQDIRLSVFRKVYLDDSGSPVDCESRLSQTVMKYLNATCTPIAPRDGSTVGDLLDNGTATGVTADLLDGYTDMELNSRILKNSYYGYIDTTYPLSQDNLCFIVPKAERMSSFMTVLRLITRNVLLILLFNVITMTTLAVVVRGQERRLRNIKDHKSVGAVILDVFKCFIRQTVDITFPGPIFRIIILMIILYSLLIDCVIDGIVTSAIAYPHFKKDMNLLSELKASNLKLAIHNRHMGVYLSSLNYEIFKSIYSRIENVSDKKIKSIFDNKFKTYAVLLRTSDGEQICRKLSYTRFGRPLYHVMTECSVPTFVVFGLRFGSPHLPRLNNLLINLQQSGILSHWQHSEKQNGDEKYNKRLYVGNSKERKPLTMAILREVFYVWLAGLFISTCAFVAEFIINFVDKLFIV